MRNSDIIFFGVMLIGVILVFGALLFEMTIPANASVYMVVILLPVGIVKKYLPKTRFGKWLNTKR